MNQKIQECSNMGLSKASKLVLLKSGAQAIPIFWMSLFSLHIYVYDGIKRKMNGFWWGQGATSKGLCSEIWR